MMFDGVAQLHSLIKEYPSSGPVCKYVVKYIFMLVEKFKQISEFGIGDRKIILLLSHQPWL